MSHTANTPQAVVFRPDILIVIALTGVAGFAFGQHWPLTVPASTEASQIVSEDWHGNVRRSDWPN